MAIYYSDIQQRLVIRMISGKVYPASLQPWPHQPFIKTKDNILLSKWISSLWQSVICPSWFCENFGRWGLSAKTFYQPTEKNGELNLWHNLLKMKRYLNWRLCSELSYNRVFENVYLRLFSKTNQIPFQSIWVTTSVIISVYWSWTSTNTSRLRRNRTFTTFSAGIWSSVLSM